MQGSQCQDTWVPVPAVTLTGCMMLARWVTALTFHFFNLNIRGLNYMVSKVLSGSTVLWLQRKRNSRWKRENRPLRSGSWVAPLARPWCFPVEHKEFHRILASNKVSLWLCWMKTKIRPLHNHVWTQTKKHPHCSNHKTDQTSPYLAQMTAAASPITAQPHSSLRFF